MSDPSSDEPSGFGYGESAGEGAGRVSLSEASQAVEDVLEGCRRELQLLRRRLQGRASEPEFGEGASSGEEDRPSPRERALHLASRLEACAGALRNASTPEG